LSDQKLTEEEIKLLQDTLQVLKNYLIEIPFEIRTPITSIKGFSELMLTGKMGPLNNEQLTSLEIIKSQGDFLLKVCNDLLDMSHIFSVVDELNIKEVNVYELIQQAKVATWEHWRLAYLSERPNIKDETSEELPTIWADHSPSSTGHNLATCGSCCCNQSNRNSTNHPYG
jgi:signal transduction histidine kinase